MTSRILIVDDTPSIHDDFLKILSPMRKSVAIDQAANALFGESTQSDLHQYLNYEVDSAFQGEDALNMIEQAAAEQRGYDLVFMDVRMPPGMDGIKTIARIWDKYPHMEIVICTAYSDYSWAHIVKILGPSEHLLVLKKPFDADEAQQMALAQTQKVKRSTQITRQMENLTQELATCNQNVILLKQHAKPEKPAG